jgi:hypothetical protein
MRQEELRRERMEKLWKQYGNYVIAAAALIVIIVLGYKYLEKVRLEAAEAAGAQYAAAMTLKSDGKKEEATKAFETLTKAASLRLADADWTEMQNRLNDLSADISPWRYNARELLGLAAFKAGKPDEASKILEPLLADRNTPQGVIERAQVVMGQIVAAKLAKQAAASGPETPKEAASANATPAPSGDAAAASEKKE